MDPVIVTYDVLYDYNDNFLMEAKDVTLEDPRNNTKKKVLRLSGIFQESDKRNINKRVYPHNILCEAVSEAMPRVQARKMLGELDHPIESKQTFKIHMDRVSHLVTNLYFDKNDEKCLRGELEVIEESNSGGNLAALINHDVCLGISSRGKGKLLFEGYGEDQTGIVTNGYKFVTWDVVADPSVKDGILALMESVAHANTQIGPKIVDRVPLDQLNDALRQYLKTRRM